MQSKNRSAEDARVFVKEKALHNIEFYPIKMYNKMICSVTILFIMQRT